MTAAHFTSLRRITVPNGDVFHALRHDDRDYAGFGEAYFTTIAYGAVKGWRRHTRMVMNLLVPAGRVRFVVMENGNPAVHDLAPEPASYGRLTVPPGCWLAFQGLGPSVNLILNIASIGHDPDEAETRPLDAFAWDWLLKDRD